MPEAAEAIQKAAERNAESLSLAECHLKRVPDEVRSLSHLRELDLSGNYFASLPNEIHILNSLPNLSVLRLRRTHIQSLPAEIFSLTKLKILDVAENDLSEIPPEVGSLELLGELDLSRNWLSSLPPEMARCRQLHTLRLGGDWHRIWTNEERRNAFNEIPPTILQLPDLRVLTMDRTGLCTIPPAIGDLRNLEITAVRLNILAVS
jgi:Leucine-rich repeat (LRR) protein